MGSDEPRGSVIRQITAVPEHLRDLWERSSKHLNDSQTEILAKVLVEYQDVFSRDDLDLGALDTVTHSIDTGTARPVKQKMRRTPSSFEKEEKTHLDDLLHIGVIEPLSSAWASPPVLVKKKRWTGKILHRFSQTQ